MQIGIKCFAALYSSGLIFAGTATLGIASLAMPQLTLLSAATGITEYYTRLTVSLGCTPLSVMPEEIRLC